MTDGVDSSAYICSTVTHSNILSKVGGGGRGRSGRNDILVYTAYRWWPHSHYLTLLVGVGATIPKWKVMVAGWDVW